MDGVMAFVGIDNPFVNGVLMYIQLDTTVEAINCRFQRCFRSKKVSTKVFLQ